MHKLLLVFLCVANLAAAQEATRSPGWVVIPIGEYETLRSKAYPVDRAAEGPPLEATLTRLDYDLRLDGPLASGLAVLTIDVAKECWSRIPIPSGPLVRDAKLNGKPFGAGFNSRRSWSAFCLVYQKRPPQAYHFVRPLVVEE